MQLDIDESLINDAMKRTGLSTPKEITEEALRSFIALKSQCQLRALRGQLRWEGDLNNVRGGRILGDNKSTRVESEPE